MILITPLETLVFCISGFITVVLVCAMIYIKAFQKKKWVCEVGIFVSLLIITGILMWIYIEIVSAATHAVNSNLVAQIASFIPAIIPLFFGYKANKALFKTTAPNTNDDSGSETDPLT